MLPRMPTNTSQPRPDETDEQRQSRSAKHEEEVYRAEEKLLRAWEKIEEKWGRIGG